MNRVPAGKSGGMDKVILNATEGGFRMNMPDPETMDLNDLKSVLGEWIRGLDRPEAEKARLHERLHAAHAREPLLELWRDVSGEAA